MEIKARVKKDTVTEEAREKLEKEYGEKLEKELKMTAGERAQARIAELEEKVGELSRENRRMAAEHKAIKLLAEKKLPQEFAGFLSKEDWENTKSNIESFEKLYFKAVEDAVALRISGTAPMTGETTLDPFVMGFRR